MTGYTCKGCGISRERSEALMPCPQCGMSGLIANMSISMTGSGTLQAAAGLSRSRNGFPWSEKWAEVVSRFREVMSARNGNMSPEEEERRFIDFFIACDHWHEHLIHERPGQFSIMTQEKAEKRISDDILAQPVLRLVRDICNTSKHGKLDRPPKSGSSPQFTGVECTPIGRSSSFLVDIRIEHSGTIKSGRKIAEEAICAWEKLLQHWGLT